MKKFVRTKKGKVVIVAVILLVVGVVIYAVALRPKVLTDKQQMESVRRAVGKLIVLPNSEDPTLATVTDTGLLTDTFLKENSQTGDKVLVYYKARKVYIYRPTIKKLVATGPLAIQASASQVAGTRVKIRNGTTSDEAVHDITNTLQNNYKTMSVLQSDASLRHDYPQTIVIDLTDGEKYDLVSNIAQSIGAVRGILPTGEVRPDDTDILIITGVQ